MSSRVDLLATDLVKNDPAAEPRLREAQLWALRGILMASGARLAPATVTRVGSQLQSMLSDAGPGGPINLGEKLCIELPTPSFLRLLRSMHCTGGVAHTDIGCAAHTTRLAQPIGGRPVYGRLLNVYGLVPRDRSGDVISWHGVAGDDESLLEVLADCLGVYARHCSADELLDLLKRGPLSASIAGAGLQLRHALTMAAIAEHAPDRCACRQHT